MSRLCNLIVSLFQALRRTSEGRLLAADVHGSAASSAALLVPPDACSILLEVSRSQLKFIACHQLNVSTPCSRRVTHDMQCQRSHWIVRLPSLHCLLCLSNMSSAMSKLTGRGLVVSCQRSPDCSRWFGWPGVRIKLCGQDLENVQQQCKIQENAFIHHKKCAFFTLPNFPCLEHAKGEHATEESTVITLPREFFWRRRCDSPTVAREDTAAGDAPEPAASRPCSNHFLRLSPASR